MAIKSKIIVTNLVIFGILISGLAYILYNRIVKNAIDAIDLRLETCASKIITEFEDEWEEEKIPEWDDILQISAEGLTQLGMTMRSIKGDVIFSDEVSADSLEEQQQNNSSNLPSVRTIIKIGQRFRKAVYPVLIDDKLAFTLTLSASIEETHIYLVRMRLILLGSLLAAMLLGTVAVFFVTQIAFQPISRMVTTAESISASKLEERIRLLSNNDEVSRLGKALNDMMDRIEAAFKSQRQFITDASHELRTPLTVIIGELEYIQTNLTQARLQDNIQTVLGELDRLSRLVDQLLTLARLDAKRLVLDKQPVRLDEILLDCVKLLQQEVSKKEVKLKLLIESAIEINADPDKMKSIILNILENAVKYSGKGKSVKIKLLATSSKSVELTVSDTGPGIPEEKQPRVFDRFYRGPDSRSSQEGFGLGLAITKQLVELHKGTIIIENAPQGGALFRIRLPIN